MKKAKNRCKCGDEAKHVHHIDKNKKNNEINNLVALCIPCHKDAHRKVYPPDYNQKAKEYGKALIEARFYARITQRFLYRKSNVIIRHKGLSLTKAQWARKIGIKRRTLQSRLNRGWTIVRALQTPLFVSCSMELFNRDGM